MLRKNIYVKIYCKLTKYLINVLKMTIFYEKMQIIICAIICQICSKSEKIKSKFTQTYNFHQNDANIDLKQFLRQSSRLHII